MLEPNSADVHRLAFALTAGPYPHEEYPLVCHNRREEVRRQREPLAAPPAQPIVAAVAQAGDAPSAARPYRELEMYAAMCTRMSAAMQGIETNTYYITVEPQTTADQLNQTSCMICKRRVLPLPDLNIVESRCRCKALCHDTCANVCVAASQMHPESNVFSQCQRCLTPMKLDRARAPGSRILASLGTQFIQCTLCDNENEPGSRTLHAFDLAWHRKSQGCMSTLADNSRRKVRGL